jgi:hypothetical protein
VRAHEIYSVNVSAEDLPRLIEVNCGESRAVAAGLPTAAERAEAAAAAAGEPAQVFSAGEHYIVSAPSRAAVQAALDELAQSGSRVLSPISQVGKKWIATRDHPKISDSCKVEELRHMRIVTGATPDAVTAKFEELVANGARLVHDIESASGTSTAVCEVSASP